MSTITTNAAQHVWAEKYRPKTLDEVIIPQGFKDSLKKYVAEGRIPSFLFWSPSPGTGKTTTAFAICNDLDADYMYINASMDNSIDDIRMKVVAFATAASLIMRPKVIVLDEADRLSTAAQESLKGLMEQVAHNASFILTCNTKSRIVDPLQSRCTSVDFIYTAQDQTKLAAQMLKRSMEILKAENIEFETPVLVELVKKYVPDNRRIVMALQKYAKEYGRIDSGILGQLASADASTLVEAMKTKDFNKVKQYCFDNHTLLGDDFYLRLFKTLEPMVQPMSVAQMVLDLNDYQRNHYSVPDRFIHFTALCTVLMMNLSFK